jgi:N-acetylglutamate synthase-like GNAT family acetyltransferase
MEDGTTTHPQSLDAEIEIRDTKDVPLEAILELFRHVDWAKHRTPDSAMAVLAQTSLLVTGWYRGRCVAMLRVLSDGVYRALVEDVIVHPDYQSLGWGRRIVETALAHPQLRDIEAVFLFTGVPMFYERFGFVQVGTGMFRVRPERS